MVTRVIDGDTIEVQAIKVQACGDSFCYSPTDRAFTVRLIGADAPEPVAPGRPIDAYRRRFLKCFGPEASAFSKRWLEGKRVRLEFDAKRFDHFERTLAYVYVERQAEGALVELLFNQVLLERGFALGDQHPQPNDLYEEQLRAAAAEAYKDERGLWGACEPS